MDFNINYKNIFAEAGYSHKEIEQKVSGCFNEIFYGENKFFYINLARCGWAPSCWN